jgi:hypothetical protein
MGVLISIIVIFWSFIGHTGSSYSAEKLIVQQLTLRDQYGLLHRPVITDPNELETPPSLRTKKAFHIGFATNV